MKLRRGLLGTAFILSTTFCFSRSASAEQNTARDESNHPNHAFELEPHALLAPFYDHGLPGFGLCGTVTLARNGFIDGVSDSVGLGFGADWTRRCSGSQALPCVCATTSKIAGPISPSSAVRATDWGVPLPRHFASVTRRCLWASPSFCKS